MKLKLEVFCPNTNCAKKPMNILKVDSIGDFVSIPGMMLCVHCGQPASIVPVTKKQLVSL